VLRTFSKWAGLAGLRIGYSIAHSALSLRMMQIKQPYECSGLTRFCFIRRSVVLLFCRAVALLFFSYNVNVAAESAAIT
jgi:hypothetical protein